MQTSSSSLGASEIHLHAMSLPESQKTITPHHGYFTKGYKLATVTLIYPYIRNLPTILLGCSVAATILQGLCPLTFFSG